LNFKTNNNEKKQIHDIAGRSSNNKYYIILYRKSISIFYKPIKKKITWSI